MKTYKGLNFIIQQAQMENLQQSAIDRLFQKMYSNPMTKKDKEAIRAVNPPELLEEVKKVLDKE